MKNCYNNDTQSDELESNLKITEDTKIILKIVRPTLKNISIVNNVLDQIIEDLREKNDDLEIVKKILVGDETVIAIGDGPGGIKKDILDIKKKIEFTRNPNTTLEEFVMKLHNDRKKENEEVLKLLKSKLPVTTKIQIVKDIAILLCLLGSMFTSIVTYLRFLH